MSQYLVTTDKSKIPTDRPIAMVDGTVPGWERGPMALHYDHHKPGGGTVQIDEMPATGVPTLYPGGNWCIVTTQVDADACVAAAWLQLGPETLNLEIKDKLWSIACDCDHLGLPVASDWNRFREFARNAVATLKEGGREIAEQIGMPTDRKDWSEEDKIFYASQCFREGTQWLIAAAKGERPWPGELGEAASYWERVEAQRQMVYDRCYLYRGVAVFNQVGLDQYIDPRLLVEWAREQGAEEPITLTMRDGARLPNAQLVNHQFTCHSYTLGSVPLHTKGSPKFSDRGVWEALQGLEAELRERYSIPQAVTSWGGRNEVGGSGWRDPAISAPSQVIDCVLKRLGECDV